LFPSCPTTKIPTVICGVPQGLLADSNCLVLTSFITCVHALPFLGKNCKRKSNCARKGDGFLLVAVPCAGGDLFCTVAPQRPTHGSRPKRGKSTCCRRVLDQRAACGNIYDHYDIYDDGDILSYDCL